MRLLFAVLVALLLVLQYRLWLAEDGVRELWRLEEALAAQEAENEQLAKRNDALRAEVKDLKTGVEAIEERARSELGMIREGETFYQVVEGEHPSE
ncbi:MAG TPA: cell division protein FtsB [Gammaproteobacteria bacterium]|nr:cell division protein FtsB [Gammaproteobacteria bacterium]